MTPDQLVTYQWFADKTEIPDADGATLAVTEDMVGKKLSVKVTSLTGEVATSEATAAVVKSLPTLVNVRQESANQIMVKFDGDASVIGTEDIEVARDEDGLMIPVEKVEPYTEFDSTTLLATVSSPFIDDTVYNVTVGSDTTSFTASVGEVAAIMIETYEAEVNKPTKVEYKLLDENSVDVTSTVKRKETVLVDITGTYKTAKTSDPTDISVTMGAVDDECEVTITYNKGTGSEEGISKTQKITCVGPTATKGTIKYCITDDVNLKSGCAKFYLDGVGTDGKVSIAVGDDTSTSDPVYFAAFDDNGAAIAYDQYEVESANEAIVAASVRPAAASGKFTEIDLVGNEVGTTQVKVIATSNTVSKEYYMNVTVKDTEDMVKVILSDSRNRTLSNAYDEDYTDKITAKIVDDNGNNAKYETIEWKLLNAENYKPADTVPSELQGTFDWVPDSIPTTTAEVKAWGAKKGTYTVQATADIADKKIAQTIKVNVSELPAKAWVGTPDAGVKLTYMVEVGSSSIGNIGTDNDIKFYALVNGLFAGYVRQDAVTIADADEAEVVLSDAWKAAVEADGYTAFRTNKMAVEEPDLNLADLATAAADVDAPDEVFTVITASGATVTTTDFALDRYTYGDIPTATLLPADKAGAYWTVKAGDAKEGGAITIGDSDLRTAVVEGTIVANEATTIADGSLTWTLQFGNKKLATGQLFDYLHSDAEPIAFYVDGITAVTSNELDALADLRDLTYIANDTTYDYDIARPGKYNVKFAYVNRSNFKTTTAENEFTVTDTVKKYVPKVTLLTKTTEDYTLDSFKEILELNVDLNNNNGLAESLVDPGLATRWVDTDGNGFFGGELVSISPADTYAKYAVVEETIDGIPVEFLVPVGANIKED